VAEELFRALEVFETDFIGVAAALFGYDPAVVHFVDEMHPAIFGEEMAQMAHGKKIVVRDALERIFKVPAHWIGLSFFCGR
jgi:hypothetical protein